jgi:L-serine/L-threonine ammonia-lyase
MQNLHIETPLIESLPMSGKLPGRVWLKMDALQPSGSFKLRGIGHACRKYRSGGAEQFISSSGGNAGIAVAYCGRKLGVPVTVVVPETTGQSALQAIDQEGADVIIHGRTWQEAHDYARRLTDPAAILLHPFDDPLIWTGHATLIDEVVTAGLKPDMVVVSVGGGGLLCGIIQGLRRHLMNDVPVLAVETRGADSLAASLKAGCHTALDDITSIATSLGAKQVATAAYQWCGRHEVISHVVSDPEAVDACLRFSKDHRILVEPACGASLSAIYSPPDIIKEKENILVVVCGGVGVTYELLQKWKQAFS